MRWQASSLSPSKFQAHFKWFLKVLRWVLPYTPLWKHDLSWQQWKSMNVTYTRWYKSSELKALWEYLKYEQISSHEKQAA